MKISLIKREINKPHSQDFHTGRIAQRQHLTASLVHLKLRECLLPNTQPPSPVTRWEGLLLVLQVLLVLNPVALSFFRKSELLHFFINIHLQQ